MHCFIGIAGKATRVTGKGEPSCLSNLSLILLQLERVDRVTNGQ